MRILVFWDSITEWYYDLNNWWWANRLRLDLWETSKDLEVGISWISGDEVNDILNRLDIVTKSFTYRYNDDIIFIFAIWINDSVTNIDWTKNSFSEIEFKNNLLNLVNKSKKFNPKKIYFVWLNNVNEDLVSPFPWSTTWKCYKNYRIKSFNKIISEVSDVNNCIYIDIFNLLGMQDLYDWIHPNSSGHEKIYKKVKEFLEKNI